MIEIKNRAADLPGRNTISRWPLILALLVGFLPIDSYAKPSSGGGRSYSSGRSSSSSSSRSYSSGSSSSRSYSSGKSYSSGSNPGKSYSSGSSSGSGKSYSSGSSRSSTSSSRSPASYTPGQSSKPGSFSYDTSAARAQKEQASKREFSKSQQSASPQSSSPRSTGIPNVGTPPFRSARPPPFPIDRQTYSTRSIRVEHVFRPYYSRPIVYYNDPYSSFFWWWLLDRSLEDRAMWAYSHRAAMDASRYQALLASDARLEAEIRRLEANQVAADPNYVPSGVDRDLMYSDRYFNQTYSNRPTRSGGFFFFIFLSAAVVGLLWFLGWFVFYKRW